MNAEEFSVLLPQINQIGHAHQPIYLVGGAVRDILLKREVHDLDFTCRGDAFALARKVADFLQGAFFVMDEEHKTARVILNDSGDRLVLDFSLMRGMEIKDDLVARDFTINAMAVELDNPFAVVDPLGGANDLRSHRLCVCSIESFRNDPIRILRAIRFAVELQLSIPPETRKLIQESVPEIVRVSPERKRDEFVKMFAGGDPALTLRLMDRMDVLQYVFPEMLALKGVEQSPPHTLDVWGHTLAVVDYLNKILQVVTDDFDSQKTNDLYLGYVSLRLGRHRENLTKHLATRLNMDRSHRSLLFLAACYHDISKPSAFRHDENDKIRFIGHEISGADVIGRIAREYHFSNQEVEWLQTVVRNHMRPILLENSFPSGEKLTARSIYRYFKATGSAGIDIGILCLADVLGAYGVSISIEQWESVLQIIRQLLDGWWERKEKVIAPKALVTGDDIMSQFGISPGRHIGELLEAVREAQVEGQIGKKEEAIALLKTLVEQK